MTRLIEEKDIVMDRDDTQDSYIVFALCSILFIPSLNNFINCILQIGLNIYLEFLTPVSYIFMAFCSVFMLYKYILRNRSMLALSLFILFGSVVSYFIYPEIKEMLYAPPVDLVYSPLNTLFYFCIPAMVGIVNIKKYDRFLKSIKSWSRVTIIIGILAYVFVCLYKGKLMQYMVYSYKMLIPICACYMKCDYNKKADVVLAVLGSLCILACGARGAVISVLLFLVILCLSLFERNMSPRNIIVGSVVMLVLLLSIIYYRDIIAFTAGIFERNGIDSRVIYTIVEGTFLEDSGRSDIIDAIIRAIKDNPLGYGFFGDRYVTAEFGMSGSYYAHNILIEVICHLGVIIGPIVLVFFVWRLFQTITYSRGTSVFKLILILIPFGLFQLFFSSDYLVCPPFFMLIGLTFFGNRECYRSLLSNEVCHEENNQAFFEFNT